jgi:glycosyltransferase involved in cell wall biosynthesis
LSRGGAGRALLTAARASAAVAPIDHSIASLNTADAHMAATARERGIDILDAPSPSALRTAIEAADIVQVHFWNSPELYELLLGDLPAMRLLLWSHVAGEHPPQVLIPELIEFCDRALASSTYTTALPGLSGLETIPAVAGWERVEGVRRGDRQGPFTVGYIGTLDFAKLHPAFVSMSVGMQIPDARFLVCGTGGALAVLRQQVAEHGAEGQFEFPGYVEDIRSAIATMDVFGYPLSEGTSATSELVLQEVMYAGVPAVVLGSGAVSLTVIHGETGFVVHDEAAYSAAVEYLYANPVERRRLGAAAAVFARRTWSPERVGPRWVEVYESVMSAPKRTRSWSKTPDTGAGRFIQSLGDTAPQFAASLRAEGDAAVDADRRIAASQPVLCSGGGGILFYRDHYPDDGWLRMWAGLVLQRQGRAALAAGEFAAAIERGCGGPRVRRYLARAMLGARLRSEVCTVAYMGASVTAQKDGYRPRLHAMLQRRFAREHVMVNAGTGAIGSIGGLFLMDQLVLRHRPDLCFIEYATTDTIGTTPAAFVGPVLEEIVCRLREAGCEPCILLLPRAQEADQGIDAYRSVASHHGVVLIDVAASFDAGDLTERVLRDVVHTTFAGAETIATRIADDFDSILDPTGAPIGSEDRLFDRSFRGATLVAATTEHLREASAGSVGTFRLSMPYVEVEPGGGFDCTFDGELVGLVVVVGPRSGVIAAGGREFTLFDRWCHYERLSTVVFEPGFPPGAPVTVAPTNRAVDRTICEEPLEADVRTTLKVVGFMVRPC